MPTSAFLLLEIHKWTHNVTIPAMPNAIAPNKVRKAAGFAEYGFFLVQTHNPACAKSAARRKPEHIQTNRKTEGKNKIFGKQVQGNAKEKHPHQLLNLLLCHICPQY